MHKNQRKSKINSGAMSFFTQEAKQFKISELISGMEEARQSSETYAQCSGMHLFEDDCKVVLDGKGSDVILQALTLGAKSTLEDFCGILNNNAVYASLFLSSTIGLLFDPPDAIADLDNGSGAKAVFFLGVFVSVLFSIIK